MPVDPWRDGVGIMELTDTDIQSNRTRPGRVSDSSFELHRLVDTVIREYDVADRSEAGDFILRVELTHAIDEYAVSFDYEDYDVAYTIPPLEWLPDEYETVELVDELDVSMEEDRFGFTTTPVVHEMVKDAVDEGAYENITETIRAGAKRLLGR